MRRGTGRTFKGTRRCFVLMLAACRGATTEVDWSGLCLDPYCDPPRKPTVQISHPGTLVARTTVKLSAALVDPNGKILSGRTFGWWSREPQVAQVGATGLVTGLTPGEAYISATAYPDGITGAITLRILPGPPVTLRVGPPSVSIRRGERGRLAASALDADGNNTPALLPIIWTSADVSIATVGTDGTVTGISVGGPISITASMGSVRDSALVTVTPGAVMVFQHMAAGFYHSCGLIRDGQVYCWGGLRVDATINPITAVSQGDLVFTQITPSCGLTALGQMFCWGMNVTPGGLAFQQIDGSAPSPYTGTHGCGLTAAGRAYCWGPSDHGQLGIDLPPGPMPARDVPMAVDQGELSFVALTVGGQSTCALTEGGRAYCWGDNSEGQIGDGTTVTRFTPTPVHQDSLAFATIEAGNNHVCALTADGQAYCWGDTRSGQGGDGSSPRRLRPGPVPQGDLRFTTLAAGFLHTCAISLGRDAFCWGSNRSGQMGNLTSTHDFTPQRVEGDLAFAGIVANRNHTCAWTPAGQAYCWGSNDYGQLGDETASDRFVPVPVKVP